MADALVPVGRHFFSPADLQRQLDRIPLDEAHQGGALAGIDSEGVNVALLYTRRDGKIRVRGAYSHDWSGDDKIAGDVLWRF